jgi:hypothetical protein
MMGCARGCIGTLLASLVLVGPALAGGGPDLRDEVVRRAAQKGLKPEQTASILQRADRIQSAELPVRAVLDRYLEGLSKNVPLPLIEEVVDELEVRLHTSADQVDQVFSADRRASDREARLALIDHGAFALAVGVPPDGLGQALRLAASEPQEQLQEAAAPVLAVGCLVAGGLRTEASMDVVRTAWTHGYRGSDLEKLGRDLGGLGSKGQGPPPEVVQRVLGLIRADGDREKLFKDLDQLRGDGPPGPGFHPPGTRPGEDPSHMRGPGGPPQDPGRQGPHGENPPPPPPPPPHRH